MSTLNDEMNEKLTQFFAEVNTLTTEEQEECWKDFKKYLVETNNPILEH